MASMNRICSDGGDKQTAGVCCKGGQQMVYSIIANREETSRKMHGQSLVQGSKLVRSRSTILLVFANDIKITLIG